MTWQNNSNDILSTAPLGTGAHAGYYKTGDGAGSFKRRRTLAGGYAPAYPENKEPYRPFAEGALC